MELAFVWHRRYAEKVYGGERGDTMRVLFSLHAIDWAVDADVSDG